MMQDMAAMAGWRSSSTVLHEYGQQFGGWRKGPWTPEEDKLLSEYVKSHGEGRWSSVARTSGLNRSGKSCRLRWVNYLRPGLKRGHITPQEEGIIIELHALWGNKWSTIARYLPGRTDNEIKNYWRTHFKKKPEKVSHHVRQERRKAQAILHRQQMMAHDSQQQPRDQLANADTHADRLIRDSSEVGKEQEEDLAAALQPAAEDNSCPVALSAQDTAAVPSWSEFMGEDGLWGGLWNLDDDPQQGRVENAANCNKMAMQNQANIIINNNSGAGIFTYGGEASGFCSNAGYYIF